MSEDETRPQDPWSFPGATAPVDAIDSEHAAATARRGGVRRGVVTAAVVVLALAAAGAAGAAIARSGDGGSPSAFAPAAATSSPSAGSGERGLVGKGLKRALRGGPGMMRGGPMGPGLGMGGALHGELVVADGNGGYRTVEVQRGKATAVSGSSITVRSEDGFTQTYAVGSAAGVGAARDGLSSISKGANVMVVGEKKGSTVTADHVVDLDSFARGMSRFGGGPFDHDGDGPPEPQPAPTGTSTSGTSFGA